MSDSEDSSIIEKLKKHQKKLIASLLIPYFGDLKLHKINTEFIKEGYSKERLRSLEAIFIFGKYSCLIGIPYYYLY